METIFISLAIFLAVFFLMAIGFILQGKVLKGSCGGLNALFGGGACKVCNKKDECKFTKD